MTDLSEKIARIRRVAKIMGPSSASAMALADYDRRRAAGETVDIIVAGSTLLVGPPLNPAAGSDTRDKEN